jgi:hypothetical protein
MPKKLSHKVILRALEKISSIRTFRFAERQQSFLRYIVRETLDGRAAQLKEYSIGIAVFGKGEAFDPRLDSIVRVEARKLRARLAKYAETEGKNDSVRFELPVGSYAPVFGSFAASPNAGLPKAGLSKHVQHLSATPRKKRL